MWFACGNYTLSLSKNALNNLTNEPIRNIFRPIEFISFGEELGNGVEREIFGISVFLNLCKVRKTGAHCCTEDSLWFNSSFMVVLPERCGRRCRFDRGNRLIRRIFNLTCNRRNFSQLHVRPPRLNLFRWHFSNGRGRARF